MLELLVISMCLGDYACGEATKAYYYQTPAIKQTARELKDDYVETVGRPLATVTPALVGLAAGATFQFKITKEISFGRTEDGVIWKYRFDF